MSLVLITIRTVLDVAYPVRAVAPFSGSSRDHKLSHAVSAEVSTAAGGWWDVSGDGVGILATWVTLCWTHFGEPGVSAHIP